MSAHPDTLHLRPWRLRALGLALLLLATAWPKRPPPPPAPPPLGLPPQPELEAKAKKKCNPPCPPGQTCDTSDGTCVLPAVSPTNQARSARSQTPQGLNVADGEVWPLETLRL